MFSILIFRNETLSTTYFKIKSILKQEKCLNLYLDFILHSTLLPFAIALANQFVLMEPNQNAGGSRCEDYRLHRLTLISTAWDTTLHTRHSSAALMYV